MQGTGGANNGLGVRGFGAGTATGVVGVGGATDGTGVEGFGGGNGIGVHGFSSLAGVGVLAQNRAASGKALQVDGTDVFSRSGSVMIAFPNKTATVAAPGGLTSSSLVLATVQDTTGVFVKAAVPNPGAGTLKIVLNKAPGTTLNPKTATVAWFVVN